VNPASTGENGQNGPGAYKQYFHAPEETTPVTLTRRGGGEVLAPPASLAPSLPPSLARFLGFFQIQPPDRLLSNRFPAFLSRNFDENSHL